MNGSDGETSKEETLNANEMSKSKLLPRDRKDAEFKSVLDDDEIKDLIDDPIERKTAHPMDILSDSDNDE